MKKIASLTLAILTGLVISPVAHAQSNGSHGVTSQEIETAISSIPDEKILSPLNPGYSLEKASNHKSQTVAVNEDFISVGDLEIHLPNSSEIIGSNSLDSGLTTYSSSGDSANAVLAESGRAQILTTISEKNADTSYKYNLDLSEGQSISILVDGSAQVVNADGSIELAIGSPWAYDANGTPVKTYYSVSGNSLIQVVEHTAENVVYPVVADPIFLAPWVVRCLVGIGLNSVQITNIASRGTTAAILAAGGYAALRCVMGR